MTDKQFLCFEGVGGYGTLYSEEILDTTVVGWKGYWSFINFKWQIDNDLCGTTTVHP